MENIVDFFLSISPIAGAFYATLFTWGLTALGASTVFFVKTMNRIVLDGMLGFTGGRYGCSKFLELIGPRD